MTTDACALFWESGMKTDEVAELTGIAANSLRDWNRRGKIPSGPKSNGALGWHNCLNWSQGAIEEACAYNAHLKKRQSTWDPDSAESKVFFSMRARCRIKTDKNYPNYGGRGITVCERWLEPLNGFLNFLEDMGRRPSPSHTIDRINNDLGYSKENCRWATMTQQVRNRRKTLRDEDGTPLADVAEQLGVKYSVLYTHFHRGKRGQELISAALQPKAGS